MRIAFIGLGNMGGGMAANLTGAGHEVRAFDLSADALAKAGEQGAMPCATIAEAVDGANAVVSMLPNGSIMRSVYLNEVVGHAPVSAILIDCSTIDVETARDVAAQAVAAGYDMVDAPVSGGIAAAAGGTLTFMVGGTMAGFEGARPVLENMGKAVIHAGEAGAGQAAKICNNMLLGIQMLGTCEAFRLAERLGLDPQKFYDIASVSSGQCWSMTSYCPVPGVGPDSPADRDYQGGFATALMLKDLSLAVAAADAVESRTDMAHLARDLFARHDADGAGARDFSSIIQTF
ncbi:3-hydroxyisobutyrate dehydrogenase [Croceicoccus sp. F390]|uniref:3-hydroxyisobutyrate dehydrogenase n=2 Tax=Croceicoccus esteveae TaxID=3075597 RepID=A0ABU2ZFD3_9SPHN|nr:3-hydroxyisobutyrate dehydrogenase [Croceicoccus sp. F390]MDT0575303.1 3-hydroxyisobutyrate dehydrogenase [Croceicoccus sp. F390]